MRKCPEQEFRAQLLMMFASIQNIKKAMKNQDFHILKKNTKYLKIASSFIALCDK